jgi:hypothetical protein
MAQALNSSFGFGSGILIGTPVGGSPIEFGVLQDVSVDFSFAVKELTGQYQFPLAVARGKGKVDGKAKFASINGTALANLFFNATPTVGQKLWSYNEAGTIPTTPFTITVANGATFNADLGVKFVSSGLQLVRVASGATTGQYMVNTTTGLYTFAAADTGKAVLLTYIYTQAVIGTNTIIGNPLMGVAPNFQIDFFQANPNVAGAQWSLRLFSCMSSKLTLASKIDDFEIPEFDFSAFANAANSIGELNPAI